jgi:hypothetical protein
MERQFRLAAGMAAIISLPAAAQLPGAPVLQNAWAAPGIVAALDIAGGAKGTNGGSAGTYAAALGWSPGNGRFQISAGGGIQSGSGTSRGVYGGRAMFSVMQMMGGKLGLAAFAGVGGGPVKSTDSITAKVVVPVGLAIGYRLGIGSSGKGFSVYTDPHFQHQTGVNNSAGYFRIGIGVDAGITRRLGATLGLETGSSAPEGKTGPRNATFGLGVSYKF